VIFICRRNALFALVIMPLAATAKAAPQQILNKTVVVTFGHHTPAKGTDGSTNTGTRSWTQQIYISEKGRLFVKAVARDGPRAVPDRTMGPEAGNWNFVGDKIVGILPAFTGANRITVRFDPSYQSCSASVLVGIEAGGTFKFLGSNGVLYTATGKSVVSNISCSISQGNVFAN
jgi:hypothetical protein